MLEDIFIKTCKIHKEMLSDNIIKPTTETFEPAVKPNF